MAHTFSLPQNCKMVQAANPQALGAVAGDYVCLKNVLKAWVVCEITRGADATDLNVYLYKATGDGVGATAFTTAVPIWENDDTAASDTLVEMTAAVSIATGVVQSKNHQIIFEVDPATMGPTYGWMQVRTDASNAAHFFAATYVLLERYQQATPPTAVA